jgi:LPXTG-motif cell wall-anchored protein
MKKVLVLMVACFALAVPSAAFAQTNSSSSSDASGNGGGGSFHDNSQSQNASAGSGSNISQQQAIGHHIAQSSAQSNSSVNNSVVNGRGGNFVRGNRGFVTGRGFNNRGFTTSNGVSGVGGGNVGTVGLARTGFEAWIVALVGAGAMAGGLGLIAARRRGLLGL